MLSVCCHAAKSKSGIVTLSRCHAVTRAEGGVVLHLCKVNIDGAFDGFFLIFYYLYQPFGKCGDLHSWACC